MKDTVQGACALKLWTTPGSAGRPLKSFGAKQAKLAESRSEPHSALVGLAMCRNRCKGCCTEPEIAARALNLSHFAVRGAGGVQGTVQGALYGARALAQGLGPLAFSYMFFFCSRSHVTLLAGAETPSTRVKTCSRSTLWSAMLLCSPLCPCSRSAGVHEEMQP